MTERTEQMFSANEQNQSQTTPSLPEKTKPNETPKQSSIAETENTPPPKTFTTVDGNTLMAQEYEPILFSVEKILPHGLFILAGSPKIGKSWLSLDLCAAVATGGKLWAYEASQGEVLYLALEDNYSRLQTRLKQMETENQDISRLHLATSSFGLQDGLLEQIHSFIEAHSGTNLIIIDTLEHIRNMEMSGSIYASDYRDMTCLREITSRHKITLMLVHHTRKMYDADPLNTISGSTGLVGSVDGVFVLEKMKRTDHAGRLTIANRDTEGFCFNLKFDADKCRWEFMGNSCDGDDDGECDLICVLMDDLVKDEWSGTATELCKVLAAQDESFNLTPASLTKQLKAMADLLKREFHIHIHFERKHSSKQIILKRKESEEKS